jgi:hypothetical protein
LSISKLQKKLNELGYCCPYGYFLYTRYMSAKELAEECGLAPRTIRWYKHNIIVGKCKCEGYCRSSSVKASSTSLPT